MNSTHKVEVVPVQLTKHPNADRLSIAQVFGYTCVVATEGWEGKSLAAYIPPDSLVPVAKEEFAFLAERAKADGYARIRAKKIRGILSFGLLVPAPEGTVEGDNLAELLGVEHYEPELKRDKAGLFLGGEVAPAPGVHVVKYDLEAGRRYRKLFEEGEPVYITEKIHGANAKYVFHEGKFHCSSRSEWKKEFPEYSHVTVESLEPKVGRERAEEIVARLHSQKPKKNVWWQALDNTPTLKAFLQANPGLVVYGEVYGTQSLRYGLPPGQVGFVAFDVTRAGNWLNATEFLSLMLAAQVPTVPVIAEREPFNFDKVCEYAEGRTLMPGADHVREGVVVAPVKERFELGIGRLKMKWVGAGYLEKE